ncbi:MAG: hypothetical protein ACNS62_11975 [Candidatus Cyclobacteriaceae bacterium M3_2C_046]
MNIELFEIVLILVIIAIQLRVFLSTYRKINLFKSIIPDTSSLKISSLHIPVKDFEDLKPDQILRKSSTYKDLPASELKDQDDLPDDSDPDLNASGSHHDNSADTDALIEVKKEGFITFNIIEFDGYSNEVFDQIIMSVNTYLIRNKGAASDFNLLKDIIERNTDAVEEDINLTISIPLYLGLMGTMLGIVIGLFSMSDLSGITDANFNDQMGDGISVLLGGVKIAMLASFSGLLLTVINSGWYFKGSKSLIENKKNQLYTFIQTELLPVISQNLNTTLVSLQQNLFKFNQEFSYNLDKLSGLFTNNYNALKTQENVLSSLEKIDISKVAKYNITVLNELQHSTREFEKFNQYLGQVNKMVENAFNISHKFDQFVARTDDFNRIASNIESRLDQSNDLLNFLQTHFTALQERKTVIQNAVIDVDNAINDSINELKQHTQHSISRVREFTIEEADALKQALQDSRTNLGNLEYLRNLNDDLSGLKSNYASNFEMLKQHIDRVNYSLYKSVRILESIEQSSLSYKAKAFGTSIQNLFVSNKKKDER